MASLEDRLREELEDWFGRLPAAWRPHFEDVMPDFDAVDDSAELEDHEQIRPQETNAGGPAGAHLFKAFYDLAPSEVRVVIFGNDPYTRLSQATGRSFEQGDLTDWAYDIMLERRISPSLKSLVCAAAATDPKSAGYGLTDRRKMIDAESTEGRRQPVWFCHIELARAFNDGAISLPAPTDIFAYWAGQGVLWLNRTLTYTKWLDEDDQDTHRSSHQRLWAPFTEQAITTIVEEAKRRPIVFVMWGSSADDLAEQVDAIRKSRNISRRNVRMVFTGHPQWAEGFFKVGNPLTQINYAVGASGPRVKWT